MSNKDKLLIIGASGHGRVIADIALKMNRWQFIAFLDEDESIKYSMEIEVIGKTSDAFTYIKDYNIFVAIGNNETRKKIQNQLEASGASIPTLIYTSVIIIEDVEISVGTVVMAGVVIKIIKKIEGE
jgi:FlaA1/EpsC-like NDP-sugar epimerase